MAGKFFLREKRGGTIDKRNDGTIAYCWRSGKLEFTDNSLPSGALIISKGRGLKWRQKVEVLCRLAYDGITYLVPGVPEAENDEEALQAVYRFRAAVEWTLLPKKEKERIAWADYIALKRGKLGLRQANDNNRP